MTDAAIYEQVSGIRDQLLNLITAVGTRDANADVEDDLKVDLMLDELLNVSNGLGRVEQGLGARGRSAELARS